MNMYLKAENKILSKFDVVEIYKELQIVKEFMNFFLNPDQKRIMEYLERPKIIFNKIDKTKDNDIDEYMSLFDSYIELKEVKNGGSLNDRIIQHFDHNLKYYFEEIIKGK